MVKCYVITLKRREISDGDLVEMRFNPNASKKGCTGNQYV